MSTSPPAPVRFMVHDMELKPYYHEIKDSQVVASYTLEGLSLQTTLPDLWVRLRKSSLSIADLHKALVALETKSNEKKCDSFGQEVLDFHLTIIGSSPTIYKMTREIKWEEDWMQMCCAVCLYDDYLEVMDYLQPKMLYKSIPHATWKQEMERLQHHKEKETIQSILRKEICFSALRMCSSSQFSIRRVRRLVEFANVPEYTKHELWERKQAEAREQRPPKGVTEEGSEPSDGEDEITEDEVSALTWIRRKELPRSLKKFHFVLFGTPAFENK
mmetsp:Transcript_4898/g.10400  ORF Transcript_4898/g.10400 Transcript_4898/m.10400 type:complete len:273 (-) Transcript_4898:123-941(-)